MVIGQFISLSNIVGLLLGIQSCADATSLSWPTEIAIAVGHCYDVAQSVTLE